MDTLAFPFEFKSIDDAGQIAGLAAAFGNVDHGGDRIIPGAFAKSLAARGARPIPMLHSHDMARPIGVWTDLRETADGLEAKGRITLATRDGQEAHALAKDGAMGGLSIGYGIDRHTFNGNARELHAVSLHEVSLVAVPMNDRARVRTVKGVANVRDLETLLRDEAGMSGRKAQRAAEAAWKAINDHDDEAAADVELAALFAASAARINAPDLRRASTDNRF